jgi:molecular chaperone GrpE
MTTEEPQAPGQTAGEAEVGEAPAADPVALLEQERDQFKALAQRTQADFVNFKRRTEQERGAAARNASSQALVRLLTVLDDLRRALGSAPADAPASWTDGVKMVFQNLSAVVQAEGVTLVEPTPGDTFDPADQEAVYYQPTDEQPAGAVLSVVQPGYRNADRVLRPAQVVVAKGPEPPAPEDPAPGA